MSLQSDLVTALSGVASGKVYPQFVPADIDLPFVVYRIQSKNPETTLEGDVVVTQYSVIFECYADDYSGALSLASDVASAISASSLTFYPATSPGEQYEQIVDAFMEPVYFGFWYS